MQAGADAAGSSLTAAGVACLAFAHAARGTLGASRGAARAAAWKKKDRFRLVTEQHQMEAI